MKREVRITEPEKGGRTLPRAATLSWLVLIRFPTQEAMQGGDTGSAHGIAVLEFCCDGVASPLMGV